MAMSPRLLRPLASGFNPKSIAGLALWLDPTVASSLTIDTGVGTWADLSGNGKNFTQAVGNNQPTLTTIGGKTALNFDGDNDHLFTTSTLFTGDLSFTFFQVFEGTFPGNGTALFTHRTGEGGADTNDITVGLAANQGANWAFGTLRTRVSATRSAVTVNADQRFDSVDASGIGAISLVGTFAASPTSTAFYRGTAAPSSAGTSGLTSVNGMSLGCRNQATPDLFYVGKMGEIIAYSRELSTAERQKVEGYLAWKWGLETQLPYDHPYARSFPGFGSQTTPSDSDTLTYLAAVKAADGTGVEVSVANAVDDFITGCKADGIWDAIKASCILAGARTLAGALVPLKGAAPTNNGPFVTGDYNRETGLIGNATTKYLNTNRNNNADPQDSHHLAVYASALDSNAGGICIYAGSGVAGAAGSTMLVERGSVPGALRARSRSSTLSSASNNEAVGFLAVGRSAAGTHVIRTNGASSSHSISSDAALNGNHFVFAGNNAGSPTNVSNGRLAYYSIGESLDLAALDTRVSALIRALRPQAANADAQDWIDRVYANGGTVSTSTASAVNTFCDAIDAAGIRDRFYRLNLFAGNSDASLNAVRTPLYRGPSLGGTQYGGTTDTNNNFVAGDYAETGATGGLKGNGTSKYLDTGFEQQTIALTDFHLSASYTDLEAAYTANRILIGQFNSLQSDFVNLRQDVTSGNFSFFAATYFPVSTTPASSTTHVLGVRSSATLATIFRGGTSVATSGTNVGTPATSARPYWIYGNNNAGSLQLPTAVRMRLYSIGQAIDGTGASAFHNAVSAFNTALSRT